MRQTEAGNSKKAILEGAAGKPPCRSDSLNRDNGIPSTDDKTEGTQLDLSGPFSVLVPTV